jgi:hypothetical protein
MYAARMMEKINAYRVLLGKPEGKRPPGRTTRRWKDNNKAGLREIGWGAINWINLAQDMDFWRVRMNTVSKLWVP